MGAAKREISTNYRPIKMCYCKNESPNMFCLEYLLHLKFKVYAYITVKIALNANSIKD